MTYEDTRSNDTSARPARKASRRDRKRRAGVRFRWDRNLPVSVPEAAKLLRIAESTLYERVRSMRIKAVGRVGRAKAYLPNDLARAFAEVGRCH